MNNLDNKKNGIASGLGCIFSILIFILAGVGIFVASNFFRDSPFVFAFSVGLIVFFSLIIVATILKKKAPSAKSGRIDKAAKNSKSADIPEIKITRKTKSRTSSYNKPKNLIKHNVKYYTKVNLKQMTFSQVKNIYTQLQDELLNIDHSQLKYSRNYFNGKLDTAGQKKMDFTLEIGKITIMMSQFALTFISKNLTDSFETKVNEIKDLIDFKNIELKNNVITKEEFNKFKSQIKTKYYKPQNNSIEEAKFLLKIGVITNNEFNVINDMRQRDSDKHKDMYINIILSAQSSLKKALKEI
tara:strand:+ start:176 stop:1072 length:897 start_codon:yes stop_codon:yes gene_type:complete